MNAAASGKPVKSLFGSLPSTERHSTGGDSSPAKRAGPAGGSPAKAAYKSPSPASRPSVAAARQLGLGTFGSPSKHDNRYPLRPASARASPVTTHLPFQDSAGAFAAHQAHALQEENRRFRAELYVLRGKADALTDEQGSSDAEARVLRKELEEKARLLVAATTDLSETRTRLKVAQCEGQMWRERAEAASTSRDAATRDSAVQEVAAVRDLRAKVEQLEKEKDANMRCFATELADARSEVAAGKLALRHKVEELLEKERQMEKLHQTVDNLQEFVVDSAKRS